MQKQGCDPLLIPAETIAYLDPSTIQAQTKQNLKRNSCYGCLCVPDFYLSGTVDRARVVTDAAFTAPYIHTQSQRTSIPLLLPSSA